MTGLEQAEQNLRRSPRFPEEGDENEGENLCHTSVCTSPVRVQVRTFYYACPATLSNVYASAIAIGFSVAPQRQYRFCTASDELVFAAFRWMLLRFRFRFRWWFLAKWCASGTSFRSAACFAYQVRPHV